MGLLRLVTSIYYRIVENIQHLGFISIVQLFAGVTLSQSGASVTWDPENKDEYPNNFKLIIKQILLGHEAKENEFNVVEVRKNQNKLSIIVTIIY